jgi:3-alpha domain
MTRLYAFDIDDVAGMRRAAAVEALSESWRGYFRDRLEEISIMDRGYDKVKLAKQEQGE